METGNLSNRESTKHNLTPTRSPRRRTEEYMTYKLSNCIVNSYELGADDEGSRSKNSNSAIPPSK